MTIMKQIVTIALVFAALLCTSVAAGLETARIDEVNDLPLISVIDLAVPSRERKPRRLVIVVATLLVGMLLSLSSVYAAWYWGAIRGRDAMSSL